MSPFVFPLFQNTNIESFLEKDCYQERYYVYIREDNTRAKSYKVKADIIKGYLDENDKDETGYFVERIYWGNGGFLTFYADENDLDDSPSRIYPGKETEVVDINDDEYYVTLTKEKAK